ncbi:MAG: hypothetical protein U5L08_13700 [Xanthomonadales bacterium]|nr:hypothetical protein [Xanthomonadales bacterium]
MRWIVCLMGAVLCLPAAQAQQLSCTPGEFVAERLDGPQRLSSLDLSEIPAAWNPGQSTLLLTWAGGDSTLQGQRFNVDLSPLDPAPTELVGTQPFEPAVTFNAESERYAVVWKNQEASAGGFNSLLGQVLDEDISTIGPVLEMSPEFGGREPWVIASGSDFEALSRSPVAVYRINSNGTLGPSSSALAPNDSIPAPIGSLAYNPLNDEYLATWRNQIDARLEGTILDNTLTSVGGNFVISSEFPTSGRAAYTFWDDESQRYLVLFGSFNDDSVRLRQVDPNGSVSPEDIELVSDQSLDSASRGRASWLADAGLLVYVRTEAAAGEESQIIVRLFDGDGNLVTAPFSLPVNPSEIAQSAAQPLALTGRDEVVFFGELFDEGSQQSSTALWRYRIELCPLIFSDRFESSTPRQQ